MGMLLGGCATEEKQPGASTGESPLAPYLGGSSPLLEGAGNGGAPDAGSTKEADAARSERRQIDELVAQCMRKEGFEYVPPRDKAKSVQVDEAFSLEPKEFAERYGYGITTISQKEGVKGEDPNEKIKQELSAEARKAYERALYGESAEGTAPSGCFAEAHGEVKGKGSDSSAAASEESFDSLFRDLEALRKRFNRDDRIVDATSEWSDCMADAGHGGLEKLDDGRKSVTDKISPSSGGGDGKVTDEIRSFERAIAVADYDCQEQHMAEIGSEVAHELESQFVAEHKAELERFRESSGEPGSRG